MEHRVHAAAPQEHTITVTVNGETTSVREGATVADLIEQLGLGQRACAVEVDRTLVPRRDHAARGLNAGAQVEIVTLVGGG